MDSRLLRACERTVPEVVRLVQGLVRVPGTSDDERRIVERVQCTLERLDYDLVFRDEVGNVVGVIAGSTDGPVLLQTSPMDRADALATQIYGGRVLQTTSPFFRGVLVVAATVAEKNCCGVGAAHLLRYTLPGLGLEPTLLIRGEPTSLDLRYRGSGQVEIRVGVAGCNHEGVLRVAERVSRRLSSLDFPTNNTPFNDLRIALPASLQSTDASVAATMTITCLIRSGRTVEDCIRWIRENVCLEAAGLAVNADVTRWTAPWSTDPSRRVVRHVREALQASGWSREQLGDGSFRGHRGLATGKELHRFDGLPTLGFGPGEERLANLPGGSVSVEDLGRGLFGTVVLAEAVLESPAWPVIFANAQPG